ncbi:hypothetical protein KDH_53220 [Dictyobacter sp. S3.2.2.5]|uniref:Uncharacterized protein n=1 Tax=Dictyobacter halimunensis TaxID=3026934 RepID=A0ABQ6FY51_9CHLR|nr:hypothetical protein KDH_53220 [Dictyobacter sp. S3.2.2.5]
MSPSAATTPSMYECFTKETRRQCTRGHVHSWCTTTAIRQAGKSRFIYAYTRGEHMLPPGVRINKIQAAAHAAVRAEAHTLTLH